MRITLALAVLAATAGLGAAVAQDEPESDGVELAAPIDAFGQQKILNVATEIDGVAQILEIPYSVVGSEAVFEGDIILGTAEELALLSLLSLEPNPTPLNELDAAAEQPPEVIRGLVIEAFFGGRPRRWPDKTVPYEIAANFPGAARITDAIAHWEQKTSLTFVKRTAANAGQFPNYVSFIFAGVGDGVCSSSVGMQGGKQLIKVGANCRKGSVVHEIGHAVGLGHEHTRADRNQFILIDYNNIIPDYWSQYQQNTAKYNDSGPYDFASIMHYGAKGSFNVNTSKPSIKAINGSPQFGQRQALSAGDVAAVEAMYAD